MSDAPNPPSAVARPDSFPIGWACVLLLVALAHYLPFLFLGEQRDAGELLVTAEQLRDGRLPYTGAYITKTPGVAYLIAGVLAVTGENLLAIRLLVLLANLACAAGTAWLCVLLGWGGRTALGAAFLYLVAAPYTEGAQILTEPFLAPCAVFAAAACVCGLATRRLAWVVLSGALCAAAVWAKQVGVLVLPPLLLALAVSRRAGPARWRLLAALGCLAGFAVVLGLLVATAVRPANWEAFINCTFFGLFRRPGPAFDPEMGLVVRTRSLFDFPAVWLPALLTVAVAAWLALWPARRHPAVLFLGALMLASLIPTWHRQFPHYYLPALPFAAALAAAFWGAVFRHARAAQARTVRLVAGAALLVLLAFPLRGFWLVIQDLRKGATVFTDLRLAEEVRAVTGGAPTLILPADAHLYFLCRTPPPTPHLFFFEESVRLMVPGNDPELLRRVLVEIQRDPQVRYVLLCERWPVWDRLPPAEKARWKLVARLPAWRYGTRNYDPTALLIFGRTDPDAAELVGTSDRR
jgi:4-amino-4-deoxy-L-arabinose transferase-like glycosyltransferase